MPMSSGGRVASSSACATRPKEEEIGLTGSAVPTQRSSLIGHYVMATAEHREPCDSRGSCTVLGAPGGEIPPGDSTNSTEWPETTRPSMSAIPQAKEGIPRVWPRGHIAKCSNPNWQKVTEQHRGHILVLPGSSGGVRCVCS